MNIGTYLYLIILFVVFSPGILFSVSSSKWVRVFTHGFLFSVVWLLTHRTVNNIWNKSVREGVTDVQNTTGTTPYTKPERPPPPPFPEINAVKIVGKNGHLSLSEVQVFSNGTNVAEGKPASQSSTGWGGLASRAVDGNTSGNYWENSTTHTNDYESPWWQVELEGTYPVQRIRIFNRTDCCGGRLNEATLYLLNGDRVVKTITLNSNSTQTFDF
jgi:hypothetical protein